MSSMDEDFATILTCPACATTVDCNEAGWQEFECNNCETEFKVKVEPEKIAQHSLF